MEKEPEFNPTPKPRRSWQKGDGGHDVTFTFSAQIFVRPFGYDMAKLKNPPYELHPWVRDVVEPKDGSTPSQQEYWPNPYRPEIWDCTTGRMLRIQNASPPFMRKGDIVWVSFHVEIIIGKKTWAPQFVPRHFIRVGAVPSELVDSPNDIQAEECEPQYEIQEGQAVVIGECQDPLVGVIPLDICSAT